jgi:hypothetical protein
MNEKEVMGLKFGESAKDEAGNKYTRTVGGWIYSSYSGQLCFIPDTEKNSVTEKADKKAKEK